VNDLYEGIHDTGRTPLHLGWAAVLAMIVEMRGNGKILEEDGEYDGMQEVSAQ